MPDFLCVLTNGTVGGELCCGSNVNQALTAKGHAICVIAVCLQLCLHIGSVVQQQIVLIVASDQLVEQVLQTVIGLDSAVDQSIQRTAKIDVFFVEIVRLFVLKMLKVYIQKLIK